MPFTFSHPAAVLPFSYFPRRWRSMTGLIMGSMAPDFEKFIRMLAYDKYSHTWESIFYFNLPLSILLAFTFHLVVRNTLIDSLPAFLQERLVVYKDFDWKMHFNKHYLVIIGSILIGTVSHIAWDAFTHIDGRFVKWLPILKESIVIGNFEIEVYNFLQLFTSVIGGIVVVFALFLLHRHKVATQAEGKLKYWIIVISVAFVIVVIRYIVGYHLRFITNLVISVISAGLLSLIITSYFIRKFNYLTSNIPKQSI